MASLHTKNKSLSISNKIKNDINDVKNEITLTTTNKENEKRRTKTLFYDSNNPTFSNNANRTNILNIGTISSYNTTTGNFIKQDMRINRINKSCVKPDPTTLHKVNIMADNKANNNVTITWNNYNQNYNPRLYNEPIKKKLLNKENNDGTLNTATDQMNITFGKTINDSKCILSKNHDKKRRNSLTNEINVYEQVSY